jgi:hypothetical protein
LKGKILFWQMVLFWHVSATSATHLKHSLS